MVVEQILKLFFVKGDKTANGVTIVKSYFPFDCSDPIVVFYNLRKIRSDVVDRSTYVIASEFGDHLKPGTLEAWTRPGANSSFECSLIT
jgi:hypothetical protein